MNQLAGTTFGIGSPTTYPGAQTAWGFSPFAGQGFGVQPLQQILQVLQIVPQQLQQLQVLQQQQLVYLQQLLQSVPVQLQQLQHLIQVVPQQVQYLQQQGHPFGLGIGGPVGFGIAPQAIGHAPGLVM